MKEPHTSIKERILQLPIEKQVEYANENLKNLDVFYNKYKHVVVFRDFIENKKKKKNNADLDATVTLPEIFNFIEQNKSLFKKEDIESLKRVHEAFDGLLPDEELVPQLFFPFVNQQPVKDDNYHARGTDETVYVFSTDPDEPDAVPSYKINDNGDYILYDDQLTEQEASQLSEVVVLGFSEDISNNPNLPDNDTISQIQQGQYLFRTYLTLKGASFTNPKESWVNGKADIHINVMGTLYQRSASYISPFENLDITVLKDNGDMKPGGKFLKKVKRSKMYGDYIEFDKMLETDFSLDLFNHNPGYYIGTCYSGNRFVDASNYPSLLIQEASSLSFADIVIFEYDAWPARKNYLDYYQAWPDHSNSLSDPERITPVETNFYVYRSNDIAFAFYRVYNIYYAYYNDYYRCGGTNAYFLDNTDEDIDQPFFIDHMNDLDHKTYFNIEQVN